MSKSDLMLLTSSPNKVKAIRQFVQTVCIFSFTDITNREMDLLCEILRCNGVNDKAKKAFIMNYETTKENYGQLIKRLSDKGILIDKEQRNGKNLHPTFYQVLELYINNEKEHHLILKWKM